MRDANPHGPARHEVVRLIADSPDRDGHSHVTAVETMAEDGNRRWSVVEFVRAVRLGERFYLRTPSANVEVGPAVCERCSRITIEDVS